MKFLNGLQPAHDLTYNDVFMVPGRSAVTSRFDVDLSTSDGTGATIPIVVANMTAVSGRRMAETIARRGGIAIIPQDIPADVVASTVARVKAAHTVYETPVTVSPTMTIGETVSLLTKRAHGAAVVVDDGKPVGIVTEHDGTDVDRFAQVREVMSHELFTVEAGLEPREYFDAMAGSHVAVAPVLDGGVLAGVITRTGALRSTIYTPAVDPERTPRRRGRRRHQRRRAGQGRGAPGHRCGRHRGRHRPRPPGEDARGPAAGRRGPRRPRSRAPGGASRSWPATSSRPTAPATWSRPAPTSSRSVSGPARCAPPA